MQFVHTVAEEQFAHRGIADEQIKHSEALTLKWNYMFIFLAC